ncbi:MAG: hydrogenase [Candidatus Hydrogenedentes bacterium]|nr:hydrogenase [Candidatus Hydrogenedentota bacterium]
MHHLARHLLRCGIALFLLGLLTGLMVPVLNNPRMALSSHLEGILNGIFLMVLSLAWPQFRLSARAQKIAFGLVLFGTYTNWGTTLLAAAWGTGTMTPIAAPDHAGASWQELIVNFGLVSLSIAMVVSCCIFIWGLRGTLVRTQED